MSGLILLGCVGVYQRRHIASTGGSLPRRSYPPRAPAVANHIYGYNRGHYSIAIFSIDQNTGKLSTRGHEATRDRTPRNFAIFPSGEFLLAANQESDFTVTFRIDARIPPLDATGQTASVPTPVYIVILNS